jgi:transcriptional regulator with XRE-family HTH domain
MIMMTIKEAREFAKMTQQDVEDEFGVPRRSLQNWEAGVRECPEYVEKWLIEKLVQSVQYAQVRWEESFQDHDDEKPQQGFSFWLNDPETESMGFSWFSPVDENGRMDSSAMWKVGKMIEAGWKVRFIG